MKDLITFYNEILENDDLKKAFAEAVQGNRLAAFLKDNGCEASVDDVKKFLEEQQTKEGEISDAELGNASGGCYSGAGAVTMSIMTAGIVCLAGAIQSVKGEGTDEDCKLCTDMGF